MAVRTVSAFVYAAPRLRACTSRARARVLHTRAHLEPLPYWDNENSREARPESPHAGIRSPAQISGTRQPPARPRPPPSLVPFHLPGGSTPMPQPSDRWNAAGRGHRLRADDSSDASDSLPGRVSASRRAPRRQARSRGNRGHLARFKVSVFQYQALPAFPFVNHNNFPHRVTLESRATLNVI